MQKFENYCWALHWRRKNFDLHFISLHNYIPEAFPFIFLRFRLTEYSFWTPTDRQVRRRGPMADTIRNGITWMKLIRSKYPNVVVIKLNCR